MSQDNIKHFYSEMLEYFYSRHYRLTSGILDNYFLLTEDTQIIQNKNDFLKIQSDFFTFMENNNNIVPITIINNKENKYEDFLHFIIQYFNHYDISNIHNIHYPYGRDRNSKVKGNKIDFYNKTIVPFISQLSFDKFNYIVENNLFKSLVAIDIDCDISLIFNDIINNKSFSYSQKLTLCSHIFANISEDIQNNLNYFYLRDIIKHNFIDDLDKFTSQSELLYNYLSDEIHISPINYSNDSILIDPEKLKNHIQIFGLLDSDYYLLFKSLHHSVSNIYSPDNIFEGKVKLGQSPVELILRYENNKNNIQEIQNIFIHFLTQHKDNHILFNNHFNHEDILYGTGNNDYRKYLNYTNSWLDSYLIRKNISNDNIEAKKLKL